MVSSFEVFMHKNTLNKGKLGPKLEPGQLKVEMTDVKNSQTFWSNNNYLFKL